MKKKGFIKFISAILALIMVAMSLPLQVLAETAELEGEEKEEYIRSVMLATSSDKEEARLELESEGYIFLDANLNEGADGKGVYMGYTTTTDPALAVYDMKLMNMDGGLTVSSVEGALKSRKDIFSQMAGDLKDLTAEMMLAYLNNSVAAEKAYKALNLFQMSELKEGEEITEENGFGYNILHESFSDELFIEMILLCDSVIMDSIVKVLSMGIQGINGNWIEKLSKLGPYDSSMDYMKDKDELERRAEQLLPVLKIYAQTYNAMEKTGMVSGTFNENFELEGQELNPAYDLEAQDAALKNAEEHKYKYYKIAFDYLSEFSYGEGKTVKDFICSLEDSTNHKQLYPLVSVLSKAEFAALSYGCVLEMILGAGCDQSDFEAYDELYEKTCESVTGIYVYAGVDKALLSDDTIIAFTDEASRHIAATGEMEFYENETWAEDVRETGRTAATLVAAGCMGLMGVAKISISIAMFWTGIYKVPALLKAVHGIGGVYLKCCAVAANPYAMIVVLAVALVVAGIFYLVAAIDEWWDERIDWDENPMPEYIYDVQDVTIKQLSDDGVTTDVIKTPTFMYYEGVKNARGEVVDLNSRSGATQWVGLYVTYEAAGEGASPLKAGEIIVKTGNGEVPEGHYPVCEFGETVAKDLNSYDESNRVNGVYMFFGKDSDVPVETGKTYYISDIYLQAGESPEHCIGLLEAAGYTPISTNLTPNFSEGGWFSSESIYSYIGYKVTTNKNSAIRDLRMSYGTASSPYYYGGATYAECGTGGAVTLYATKYQSAGTPILAGGLCVTTERSDAPEGYEPVNLFTGGPAMTFNTDNGDIRAYHYKIPEYYLYFLPEKTFTEGEEYLGGLAYFHTSDGMMTHTLSNLSYDSDKQAIVDKLYELTGKTYPIVSDAERIAAMTEYLMYRIGYDGYAGDGGLSESFVYYKTYNPYRALYSLKATGYSDVPLDAFLDSMGHTALTTLHYREDPDFAAIRPMDRPSTLEMDIIVNDPEASLDAILYIAGNPGGNTYDSETSQMSKTQPIKMSEFLCLPTDAPAESIPGEDSPISCLQDIYDTGDVSFKAKKGSKEFKIYAIVEDVQELPYVSGIFTTDTASLFRMYGGADSGIPTEMLTRGIAMSVLGSKGANRFCSQEVDMIGWAEAGSVGNSGLPLYQVNTLYYGYSKTDKKSSGYTDIVLYYGGITNAEPEDKIYKGSVKYDLVCEISAYNYTGMDDAMVPRVYLYATTDTDAGAKIIDFTVSSSPFMEGYETVRTINGGSLIEEINDHLNDEKALQDISSGEYYIKNWLTFFKNHDDKDKTNCNGGIYLHFMREGGNTKAQKPYIEDVFIAKTEDNEATVREKLFAMGADGYLKKDLNAGAWSDVGIYLGYKLTADPEKAITNIVFSHSDNAPEKKTDSNLVVYTLAADVDLNEDCGFWSDYIYLYYTKDRAAGDPLSGLSISEKIKSGDITEDTGEGYYLDAGTYTTAKKWNSSSASDLNEDAGGDYIYLILERKNEFAVGTFTEPDYGKAKTYTRKGTTGGEEGLYVASLFVMDKNTIRQEKLSAGVKSDKCECSDIADSEVIERLFAMGAVTVIETPILIEGKEYSGFAEDNKNKVFIGYNRTDTLRNALKDLIVYSLPLSADTPEETVYVNKKSFKLVAEAATKVEKLPEAINLIGIEDGQDALLPRMYLYGAYSGTDPVYDICINSDPITEGWSTALSQETADPFDTISVLASEMLEAYKEESDNPYSPYDFTRRYMNNLINAYRVNFDAKEPKTSRWYIHTKHHDKSTALEGLPFISQVFIAYGDNKSDAIAELLKNDPDGFVDCNLNKGAGGKHIYLGYKRTDASESSDTVLRDIIIVSVKNPLRGQKVTVPSGDTVKYDLCTYTDLNKGAGGDYLYLYTTTNEALGDPIISLRAVSDTSSAADGSGYTESYVKKLSSGVHSANAADFNSGTGEDNVYLIMRKAPLSQESTFPASLIGNGSAWIILAFIILGATGAVIVVKKKKKIIKNMEGE